MREFWLHLRGPTMIKVREITTAPPRLALAITSAEEMVPELTTKATGLQR